MAALRAAIQTQPGVRVGDHEYFTVAQLAVAVGCNPVYIVNLVREGRLHGEKIGQVYLIDAEEFRRFVRDGHFHYQPRRRRGGSLEADVARAEQNEQERLEWQAGARHAR